MENIRRKEVKGEKGKKIEQKRKKSKERKRESVEQKINKTKYNINLFCFINFLFYALSLSLFWFFSFLFYFLSFFSFHFFPPYVFHLFKLFWGADAAPIAPPECTPWCRGFSLYAIKCTVLANANPQTKVKHFTKYIQGILSLEYFTWRISIYANLLKPFILFRSSWGRWWEGLKGQTDYGHLHSQVPIVYYVPENCSCSCEH